MKVSMEPTSSVLLVDAEHHSPYASRSAAELRAAALLHLLFSERLVVTDSQALNNSFLRDLVTGIDPELGLQPLLHDGLIKIALRSGSTFSEVTENQKRRGVQSTPSLAYAATLDDLSEETRLRWDLTEVQNAFREGALSRLADVKNGPFAEAAAAEQSYEWISGRKVLNFADFQDWVAKSHITQEGRIAVTVLVGLEYRMTLPRVLGLDAAEATDPSNPTAYFDLGQEQLRPLANIPVQCLRPNILARIPTEVFLAARHNPSIREVKRQMLFAQTDDRRFSESTLTSAIRTIAGTLDAAATLHVLGRDQEAAQVAGGPQSSMRVRIGKPGVLGNGLLLFDLVHGAESISGWHGFLSLVLAASGIYGDSLADRRARRRQEVEALREFSAGLDPGSRLWVKERHLSRAVVPPQN